MAAKGQSKTGGRRKGTPNKLNADVKAMILGALDDVGGQEYLAQQASSSTGSSARSRAKGSTSGRVNARRRSKSSANRNPPKRYGRSAPWNGSPSRKTRWAKLRACLRAGNDLTAAWDRGFESISRHQKNPSKSAIFGRLSRWQ
jgi:hypothetical protein